MKKQKGFMLIVLLISVAIMAILFSKIYFTPNVINEKTGESETLFKQGTDAVQEAKDIKKTLEEKSRIETE